MAEWLKDKVAVITGAGGGIGRGVALDFARQGAKVVVNDLGGASDGTGASTRPAQVVVDDIIKMGGQAAPNYDSVATMAGGERIIKTAVDTFGRIDILVTCAGILRDRMVFNMTEQEWDAVIATHLKGTFACVKPASILMRQQRSGRIITFTSTSGLYGNVGQANYSAAKSAIAGFTKAIALDLGRYGITANTVAPMAATRLTVTDEVKRSLELKSAKGIRRDEFGGYDPDLLHADPLDVAPVVTYLASDLAAHINGQALYIVQGILSWVAPPRPYRSIYKAGRWTVDELIKEVPESLTFGIVNPAPVPEAKA